MTDDFETTIEGPSNAAICPKLALRIGVTGARSLHASRLEDLHRQVFEVLTRAQQIVLGVAKEPRIASFYAAGPPLLRVISPIARGADQLVARAAVELGYKLHVPMPFPKEEYEEKDFKDAEDLNEFHRLLEKAEGSLALDGSHNIHKDRAYESVGQFVVRNSDIVVAIWDGKEAKGRGGTEEIIRFALDMGVPVWWIHASESRAPSWVLDIKELRDPQSSTEPPWKLLQNHITQLIRPPEPISRVPEPNSRERRSRVRKFVHLGQSEKFSPVADYYAETPLPARGIWQFHSLIMRIASGRNPPWVPPLKPEDDPLAQYWFDLYGPADGRAGEYAARYRSSYIWIFLFAWLVLVFGAFALMIPAPQLASFFTWLAVPETAVTVAVTVLELSMFVAIGVLVGVAMRCDWHDRSIEYRLLAELCRKQQVLAPLGRAISLGAVRGMDVSNRAQWVASYFEACKRASLLPTGEISQKICNKSVLGLIDGQLQYHSDRAKMAQNASRFFARSGANIFYSVAFLVILKLLVTVLKMVTVWKGLQCPLCELIFGYCGLIFGYIAITLAGLSAAFFGIRSYAELDLLDEQSHYMLGELDWVRRRIERLDLQYPMASQELGSEIDEAAKFMLLDLEGWERLFRGKILEAQT